jgi:hypothetical protein
MGGVQFRDSKIDSPDLHRNLPNQHGQETKTGQAKYGGDGWVGGGTEVEGQAEGNGGGIRMDAGKQLPLLSFPVVHPRTPSCFTCSSLLCSSPAVHLLKILICD